MAALYDQLVRGKVIDLADGLPLVLTAYQPRLKFWLLDEGQFSAEYLNGLQRVMAAIFRMEHTHDTEEAKQAIR